MDPKREAATKARKGVTIARTCSLILIPTRQEYEEAGIELWIQRFSFEQSKLQASYEIKSMMLANPQLTFQQVVSFLYQPEHDATGGMPAPSRARVSNDCLDTSSEGEGDTVMRTVSVDDGSTGATDRCGDSSDEEPRVFSFSDKASDASGSDADYASSETEAEADESEAMDVGAETGSEYERGAEETSTQRPRQGFPTYSPILAAGV